MVYNVIDVLCVTLQDLPDQFTGPSPGGALKSGPHRVK